jgi:dihydroorotase-like cyclic amidohydrolase
MRGFVQKYVDCQMTNVENTSEQVIKKTSGLVEKHTIYFLGSTYKTSKKVTYIDATGRGVVPELIDLQSYFLSEKPKVLIKTTYWLKLLSHGIKKSSTNK